MQSEAWIDELRAGRNMVALDHLRREPMNPSNFISLGAVYMWAADFQAALAHFQDQIQAALYSNFPSDLSYGMAGTAAWCLGDQKLAVKYWRKGTKPRYAVGGSNTRTSLLLYAASVLDAGAFSVRTAEKLLKEKVSHWRVKHWAGPLAEFILGMASEETVREKTLFESTRMRSYKKNTKSWQLDFYRVLKEFADGNVSSGVLERELQNLLSVKGSEYLDGANVFYFLRMEEFYIARHGSSRNV